MTITFGKGGVDDAEDAEVIVHEYGHSVQDDQVSGFGSTLEAGSIGEAFGDYLAVTVTSAITDETSFDEACVATGIRLPTRLGRRTACAGSTAPSTIRRTSAGKCMPTARCGLRRYGGLVGSLGNTTLTDKVIVAAQFGFKPDTSFRAAAEQTIATAKGYGVANQFRQAFTERGFLG